MAPERAKRSKRIGRPPAGERGERVKDYPQVSVRLPRVVRDRLLALSQLRSQPQWRLIVDSVECYLRDLAPEERREVERLVRQTTQRRRTAEGP
jgi:predicted DNA-binding protein